MKLVTFLKNERTNYLTNLIIIYFMMCVCVSIFFYIVCDERFYSLTSKESNAPTYLVTQSHY